MNNLETWDNNPYIHFATSNNTRKAYRCDITHFLRYGGVLPSTPENIVSYIHLWADKLNPRTLARRIMAIKAWHMCKNIDDPTIHPIVKKTMTGIQHKHGKPKEKAHALSSEELSNIVDALKQSDNLIAVRDSALLQIGYFGALRSAELVAICLEDIKWIKEGIEILLPVSKTDQIHQGQYCAIPYGNDDLCAVRALNRWLDKSGIVNGAIFRRVLNSQVIGDHPLIPQSVSLILQRRGILANLDVSKLSSHSLRRGLATSAAKAGAPLQSIMRAGRWKRTDTVMEYLDSNDRFSDNAASHIINNQREKNE